MGSVLEIWLPYAKCIPAKNHHHELMSINSIYTLIPHRWPAWLDQPLVTHHLPHASTNTVVRKFFDRKYFIDKKIQGKIFSWMHDFLEIFLP